MDEANQPLYPAKRAEFGAVLGVQTRQFGVKAIIDIYFVPKQKRIKIIQGCSSFHYYPIHSLHPSALSQLTTHTALVVRARVPAYERHTTYRQEHLSSLSLLCLNYGVTITGSLRYNYTHFPQTLSTSIR